MSDFRPLGGKAETIRSRQIGDIVIQAGANTLASGEIEVRLEPLVMDLLSMLAEQPNSVVSRDALLETLWHKRHGADESLTRAVSSLRKSFRMLNTSSVSIETVPKRGYKLVVSESVISPDKEEPAPEELPIAGLPIVTISAFETIGEQALPDIGAEIAQGLSRFSWLRTRMADTLKPDSRFHLVGSQHVRSGKLNLIIRLFDRKSDTVAWSRRFETGLDAERDPLDAIDELAGIVTASLADPHGRLMAANFAEFAQAKNRTMSGRDAVVRTFLFKERLNAEDHLETRNFLDRARAAEPHDADIWAASAYITIEEYKHDFNPLPDSRDRALSMARRAVDLDQRNSYAQFCLAEVHYFRREYRAFKSVAERAIELNPYDSDAIAMIGIMMFYGGDRDRGVELTLSAMRLNPDHPGWYRFAHIYNDVVEGNLNRALDWAERVKMPGYYADPYVRAQVLGLMGKTDEARRAADEMLALWGDDLATFYDKAIARWVYRSPALVGKIVAGLEAAGIVLPDNPRLNAVRER